MKSVLLFVSIFSLTACEPKSAADVQTTNQSPPVEKAEIPEAKNTNGAMLGAVEVLEFDGNVPAGIEVAGKVQGGLRWKDKSGENLIIFDRAEATTTPEGGDKPAVSVTMTARHVVATGNAWTLVRIYEQMLALCDLNTRADLNIDAKNWSITDIDKDGIAEATWVWFSSCKSNVSPDTKKLIMTIGDKEYPLVGYTKVEVDAGGIIAQDFTVDSSFADLDTKFLDHAKNVWIDSGN